MFTLLKRAAFLVPALLLLAPAPRGAEPPAKPLDPAVEKACVEFAKKIEAGLNAGEAAALDQGFDQEAFINKVLAGIQLSDKSKAGARAGLRTAISQYGASICGEIEKGGSYKFLRVRSADGRPRAIFRMISGGGVNYHEYPLTAAPGGAVKFDDIFIFLAGENISQIVRRPLLQLAASEQRDFLDKLLGAEGDFVRNLPKIGSLTELLRAGKNKEALAVYAGLPDSLKREKMLMLLRFKGAAALGTETKEYAEAMDDFIRFFPGEQWVDMIVMDAYVSRKQYDKALAAVNRLDQAVGGDPWLTFIRANIAFLQDQLDETVKLCNAALAAEPDLVPPHETLLAVHLKRKNFKEIAALLADLEGKHNIVLTDLAKVPDYAEFLKSEEGQQWQAARKKAPAAEKPPPAEKAPAAN